MAKIRMERMTPEMWILMVMSWSWTGGTVRLLGLTRSKLLSSKYYTNNIMKNVDVQETIETSSINTEIRKFECIEMDSINNLK